MYLKTKDRGHYVLLLVTRQLDRDVGEGVGNSEIREFEIAREPPPSLIRVRAGKRTHVVVEISLYSSFP